MWFFVSDSFGSEQRSWIMSRIRAEDTQPELVVRRFLHSRGFRYRLHDGRLPGKPDVSLPKYQTVVFVHGCFWHAHSGCKYFRMPKTREEYWRSKISRNVARDAEVAAALTRSGWTVLTVWECELRGAAAANRCAMLVEEILAAGG